MTRSVFVLVVVLALVLAGCSGLVPGGDGTPTETVSPAAVPTDQPTPTPVAQLAPGLTGQAVTEPLALKQAHASVLHNTSFTLHREKTVRLTNGTPYSRTAFDVQLAPNETRYDVILNVSGDGDPSYTGESWSNGERILTRQTRNGSASYSVPRGPNAQPVSPSRIDPSTRFFGFDPVMDSTIYTLFGAVETHVVGETTRNGTTLYEVTATNMTRNSEFETGEWNHPRNLSLRALVSPQGLVREYRLDYTATLRNDPVPPLKGETVRVHRAVRYTGLGNTTIERPPWYDAAMKNVSTTAPTTAG